MGSILGGFALVFGLRDWLPVGLVISIMLLGTGAAAYYSVRLLAVRRGEVTLHGDQLTYRAAYPWGKSSQLISLHRSEIASYRQENTSSRLHMRLQLRSGRRLTFQCADLFCRHQAAFAAFLDALREWLQATEGELAARPRREPSFYEKPVAGWILVGYTLILAAFTIWMLGQPAGTRKWAALANSYALYLAYAGGWLANRRSTAK